MNLLYEKDSDMKIKARIFIVGAPRSGNTLLQTMLAAHPDINVFPEIHFFHMLFGWNWGRAFSHTHLNWKELAQYFKEELLLNLDITMRSHTLKKISKRIYDFPIKTAC